MEELSHERTRNLSISSSTFLQLQPILLEYSKALYLEMSSHRYWYQNTNTNDYHDQVRKFKKRLEARGHAHVDLIPIFKEVFITFDKESKSPPSTTAKTVSAHVLFQHGEYHPRGISQCNICHTFVDTIGNNSSFDRFIVAYSRPWNIRDALIKSNLTDTEGVCTSSFL
jgi:hypothetical protein